jgi:hypothetical protein
MKPDTDIANENSGSEFDRNVADGQVSYMLRTLAANIIRVARGTGKPHEICLHAAEFLKAVREYHEVFGHFPSSDGIAEVLLQPPRSDLLARSESEGSEVLIMHGCLQIVASRLLGQMTHLAIGEHEMYRGIRELEKARAQERPKLEISTVVEKAGLPSSRVRFRPKPKSRAPKE